MLATDRNDAGSVRNGYQLYTAYYYDIEDRITKKVQQNLQNDYDITTLMTHAHGQWKDNENGNLIYKLKEKIFRAV